MNMPGLKYSRQRSSVLHYLRSVTSHPTAEHVYQAIREEFPKISLGTVYRNLNLLADQGEILRLNCGDGVDHFDAVVEPHDHFICRSCGQVLDLPLVSMEAADRQAEQLCAGRMEGHELYFYGTCNSCLSK